MSNKHELRERGSVTKAGIKLPFTPVELVQVDEYGRDISGRPYGVRCDGCHTVLAPNTPMDDLVFHAEHCDEVSL